VKSAQKGNMENARKETREPVFVSLRFHHPHPTMLDLDRLEKPRLCGGKLIARCPACAENGSDKAGEHLFIADDGRGPFGCIVNPGPHGEVHRKRIWELAGSPTNTGLSHPLSAPRVSPMPKSVPRIPPLRRLAVGEMDAVATLRGWPLFAGLELLTRRGLLWQGDVFDDGQHWPAWIVADSTRRNAQARRLDGQPWQGIGDAKAKTLPGCDPSWHWCGGNRPSPVRGAL
jgi:hypothetical protein